MFSKLFYAIILTILPISELRIGLPVAISYALENNIPIVLIFLLIVMINILLIPIIFLFLDYLHHHLMKISIYNRVFGIFLKHFQKRIDQFEKNHNALGFIALTLFVAIPLPGTGAWSGTLLSWLFGLKRKESIIAISLGVLIAGILILFGTLGFIKIFE